MIKRISLIIFCLMLIGIAAGSALFAASAYTHSPRVFDEGDLLTQQEEKSLKNKLDTISEKYECDVVVATVSSLWDLNAEEYSDVIFESLGYGMGDTKSCIMLLVCMENRDWALTPYGKASKYFPLYVQDDMIDNFLPYLSDEDFCSAFNTFAEDCEYEFANYGTMRIEPKWVLIAAAAGIIIGFIVVFIMKSQLRTVRFQPAASSYIKSGSLNVTHSRDIFLYSTVSRTPKPKNNSSGGGAGSPGPRSSGKF